MDHIILGLLLLRSRTIYQLRERIGQGLSLMYSSSMGSIQAAVKKLLRCGYIGYEETVEGGRYKKCYHITESGKERFLAWVNAPIEQQGIRCPALVKLYFMGFADPQRREAGIQDYLTFLKEQHRALEAICEEGRHMSLPQGEREIFDYQFLSALYGRDFFQFNIQWFEDLLHKMRSGAL